MPNQQTSTNGKGGDYLGPLAARDRVLEKINRDSVRLAVVVEGGQSAGVLTETRVDLRDPGVPEAKLIACSRGFLAVAKEIGAHIRKAQEEIEVVRGVSRVSERAGCGCAG